MLGKNYNKLVKISLNGKKWSLNEEKLMLHKNWNVLPKKMVEKGNTSHPGIRSWRAKLHNLFRDFKLGRQCIDGEGSFLHYYSTHYFLKLFPERVLIKDPDWIWKNTITLDNSKVQKNLFSCTNCWWSRSFGKQWPFSVNFNFIIFNLF